MRKSAYGVVHFILTVGVCLLSMMYASNASAAEIKLLDQPCRVMDTRLDLDGTEPIQANSLITADLSGLESEDQGGVEGCGIPLLATSVKLLVHGWSTDTDGGYMQVYNADTDPPKLFASLTLQDIGQSVSIQVDIPILQPDRDVNIATVVNGHVVADVAGWNEPCIPEDTFGLTYSESTSSISVPETGDVDLLKYFYGTGSSIWLGGAASQSKLYNITGSEISSGRQRLFVSPTPETATDVGLEVHLLSGDCSPRETLLDGAE